MAISTQGTQLKWGATLATAAQVVSIKDFPDLIGSPNPIETTTLDDTAQTFINGIKQGSVLEFTFNYTSTDFGNVVDDEDTALHYLLDMGTGGKFIWQGSHFASVPGAGVDGVIEGKISVAPSTAVTKVPLLTGVAVAGTPKEGVASALTLTYTATPITTPTFAYQWKLSTTAGGTYTNITGATNATYSPVNGDVGKYLKCQVTATVYATGVILSTASAQITAA
jgi:hypothetical protein